MHYSCSRLWIDKALKFKNCLCQTFPLPLSFLRSARFDTATDTRARCISQLFPTRDGSTVDIEQRQSMLKYNQGGNVVLSAISFFLYPVRACLGFVLPLGPPGITQTWHFSPKSEGEVFDAARLLWRVYFRSSFSITVICDHPLDLFMADRGRRGRRWRRLKMQCKHFFGHCGQSALILQSKDSSRCVLSA